MDTGERVDRGFLFLPDDAERMQERLEAWAEQIEVPDLCARYEDARAFVRGRRASGSPPLMMLRWRRMCPLTLACVPSSLLLACGGSPPPAPAETGPIVRIETSMGVIRIRLDQERALP